VQSLSVRVSRGEGRGKVAKKVVSKEERAATTQGR
jgi:hypothetical protein